MAERLKRLPASASNAGDRGSIPGSGIPPEEEMATPSSVLAWRIPWTEEPCLENPMDGGAWRAVVHGVAGESDTT